MAVSIGTSRPAGSGFNSVEKISRNSKTRVHESVTNSLEPFISSPIVAALDDALLRLRTNYRHSIIICRVNEILVWLRGQEFFFRPSVSRLCLFAAPLIYDGLGLSYCYRRTDRRTTEFMKRNTSASDSPVSRLEKKRKHLRDILFCFIVLRPNNTAYVEGISLAVIEIVSSPAKRSLYITRQGTQNCWGVPIPLHAVTTLHSLRLMPTDRSHARCCHIVRRPHSCVKQHIDM